MAGVLTSEHAATAAASDVRHGDIAQRSLITLLLRLKWTLWKRSYRKNVGKIVGTVFGSLYGVGGLVGLVFMFLGTTLWSGEGSTFPTIIRGVGAATVLAWLLIPLLAFGVDDTLDPRRFALFPRSAKELQPGLFAAAALSLPTLFTGVAVAIATAFEVIWLIAFGQGIAWILAALLVLIPANIAATALCVLLPRAVFAHSASRSTSRSGREVGGIIAMLVLFAAIYGLSVGMQAIAGVDLDTELIAELLLAAVTVAAWTPFGALFAVPMDVAEGQVLVALIRTLIGIVTIALVWLWWRRSIELSLTSALSGDASSGATKVAPLVPRFVRPSAFGAVMGKSLRYWRRDTRYLAAIGIYPVILVFFAAMGMVLPDTQPMMLGFVVMMCGMSGITLANEIGFDGPSGWVNLTAGLRSRPNQLGRVAAMALIMVPAIIVVAVAAPLLFGWAHLIPLTLMGSLGITVTGWGASLATGVIMPYPSSPPGTNPMKDKSASSTNAMLAMSIAMLAVGVPQLPAISVAIWGLVVGSAMIQLIAGAVSLLTGVLVFLVGLRIGTARLDARYPDLFQKVKDFV